MPAPLFPYKRLTIDSVCYSFHIRPRKTDDLLLTKLNAKLPLIDCLLLTVLDTHVFIERQLELLVRQQVYVFTFAFSARYSTWLNNCLVVPAGPCRLCFRRKAQEVCLYKYAANRAPV